MNSPTSRDRNAPLCLLIAISALRERIRTTPTVKVVAAVSVSMAAATTAVSRVRIVSMRAMLAVTAAGLTRKTGTFRRW
jgi:hypothetical protein